MQKLTRTQFKLDLQAARRVQRVMRQTSAEQATMELREDAQDTVKMERIKMERSLKELEVVESAIMM